MRRPLLAISVLVLIVSSVFLFAGTAGAHTGQVVSADCTQASASFSDFAATDHPISFQVSVLGGPTQSVAAVESPPNFVGAGTASADISSLTAVLQWFARIDRGVRGMVRGSHRYRDGHGDVRDTAATVDHHTATATDYDIPTAADHDTAADDTATATDHDTAADHARHRHRRPRRRRPRSRPSRSYRRRPRPRSRSTPRPWDETAQGRVASATEPTGRGDHAGSRRPSARAPRPASSVAR